jgi:Golgi apparatus protein 1
VRDFLQTNSSYENIYDQLRPGCLEEIRRVMRQRAVSVDLQPEVEEVCLDDLAAHCPSKTGKGEEMVCLQDKLEE